MRKLPNKCTNVGLYAAGPVSNSISFVVTFVIKTLEIINCWGIPSGNDSENLWNGIKYFFYLWWTVVFFLRRANVVILQPFLGPFLVKQGKHCHRQWPFKLWNFFFKQVLSGKGVYDMQLDKLMLETSMFWTQRTLKYQLNVIAVMFHEWLLWRLTAWCPYSGLRKNSNVYVNYWNC